MRAPRFLCLTLMAPILTMGFFVPAPATLGGDADDIRVREDVDTLLKPENKAKLDALKLAFKTLQDSQDATKNMKFWANIHGAPPGEKSTGPCEHISEVIWPWHRAYLYQFETALRKSHPPETSNVTLPYWNWTAPPSGQRFPRIFEEAGSSLNYAFRITTPFPDAPVAANAEEQMLDIPLWEVFGGRLKTMPGKGQMESQLHDTVHGFIGGHNISTARSARDPLFWAHHANLDRIWLEWQAKYGQNPVEGDEPIAGLPGTTVKDWNDVSKKYRYGPKASASTAKPHLFTHSLTIGKTETAARFPVKVAAPGKSERLILELKDVRPPTGESSFFTGFLYLHPETENLEKMTDAMKANYLLTEFGYWDSTHAPHGDAAAHPKGADLLFDVTKRSRAILQLTDDRPLVLSMRFIGNVQGMHADHLAHGVATGVRIADAKFQARPVPAKKDSLKR